MVKKKEEQEKPAEEEGGLGQPAAEDYSDKLADLEQRLKEKEDEAEALIDRLKRLAAEFENYKKRSAKEKEEFKKFSQQSLVRELLPVVDNLERALLHGKDNQETADLLNGVKLTLDGLIKCLEKFGVIPFDSIGQPFDPEKHEAMNMAESTEAPPNMIIAEHRRGYIMWKRVIRPSLVTVSKAVPAEQEATPEKNEGNETSQ